MMRRGGRQGRGPGWVERGSEYGESEDEEEWAKAVNAGKMSKGDKLGPADHSKINYIQFRKNFYIESTESSRLTPEEVAELRAELDGIKVRGADPPHPLRTFTQAGLSNKVLEVRGADPPHPLRTFTQAGLSKKELEVRGADPPTPLRTFTQAGLSNKVLEVLKKNGFEKPLSIQAQSLPIIMAGRDCIGIAKTGSGKTLAFVLPMMRHIKDQPPLMQGEGPIALVMAPTRELEIKRFAKPLDMNCVAVFGGSGVANQISELKRGAEVVSCTPGRMIDLLVTSGGEEIKRFAKPLHINCVAVFGGSGDQALCQALDMNCVAVEIKRFAKPLDMNCVAVFGGSGVANQISELKRGAEVVSCTPGRMIDLLVTSGGKITNLRRVTYLVLDEADRMFDMGFEPQIMRTVQNIRPDRQTVMFSATFPRQVEVLARKVLINPLEIQALPVSASICQNPTGAASICQHLSESDRSCQYLPASVRIRLELPVGGRSVVNTDIDQLVEIRPEADRFLRLLELLGEWYEKGKLLIFLNSKEKCDTLFRDLLKYGYPCLSLHGGKEQSDRECTISDFKNNVCNRLDVKDLVLVVNYDVPNHHEDYVHRVGRTGRAGMKGTAITFISPEEDRYAPDLIKALKESGAPIPQDLPDLSMGFLDTYSAAPCAVVFQDLSDLSDLSKGFLLTYSLPLDLSDLSKGFQEKRRQGLVEAHGSGYGGSGYKFDSEEHDKVKQSRKDQAKEYGYVKDDDAGASSDEDDGGEIRLVAGARSQPESKGSAAAAAGTTAAGTAAAGPSTVIGGAVISAEALAQMQAIGQTAAAAASKAIGQAAKLWASGSMSSETARGAPALITNQQQQQTLLAKQQRQRQHGQAAARRRSYTTQQQQQQRDSPTVFNSLRMYIYNPANLPMLSAYHKAMAKAGSGSGQQAIAKQQQRKRAASMAKRNGVDAPVAASAIGQAAAAAAAWPSGSKAIGQAQRSAQHCHSGTQEAALIPHPAQHQRDVSNGYGQAQRQRQLAKRSKAALNTTRNNNKNAIPPLIYSLQRITSNNPSNLQCSLFRPSPVDCPSSRCSGAWPSGSKAAALTASYTNTATTTTRVSNCVIGQAAAAAAHSMAKPGSQQGGPRQQGGAIQPPATTTTRILQLALASSAGSGRGTPRGSGRSMASGGQARGGAHYRTPQQQQNADLLPLWLLAKQQRLGWQAAAANGTTAWPSGRAKAMAKQQRTAGQAYGPAMAQGGQKAALYTPHPEQATNNNADIPTVFNSLRMYIYNPSNLPIALFHITGHWPDSKQASGAA
eukprot:gene3694-13762_t